MNDSIPMLASSLCDLPDELLLNVLSFVEIPDLLNLSRASIHLRGLSHDPLLHSFRLRRASVSLSYSISSRPSLAQLILHRIYVTRTTLAARDLGRSLISIKLNRKLSRRPNAETLVEKGVLPRECYSTKKNGQASALLAPSLVETKRRFERERLRDFMRAWVEEWRKKGCERKEKEGELQRPDVRRIARRFAMGTEIRDQPRWGRKIELKEAPTRAKVLGLRKFWERVGRDYASA